MKKQTSPPNRRGRLVLLCFVLGLILIVMLMGTVYLQHRPGKGQRHQAAGLQRRLLAG